MILTIPQGEPNLPELIAYLEQFNDPFLGGVEFYRQVLAQGRPFSADPLTLEEEALVGRARRRAPPPEPKRCFANSQRLALKCRSLEYVEGFVWRPGLWPTQHAWLHIEGKVVEVTAREAIGLYFGVAFSPEEFRNQVKTCGAGMTLLDG